MCSNTCQELRITVTVLLRSQSTSSTLKLALVIRDMLAGMPLLQPYVCSPLSGGPELLG